MPSQIKMTARTPESCQFRQTIDDAALYRCDVLSALLMGDLQDGTVVSEDVCKACCRLFEPSTRDLNPVIASLVWSRVSEALTDELSLNNSERSERLSKLLQFAESNIPVVLGDENDLPVFPKQFETQRQIPVGRIHESLPELVEVGQQINDWAVGVTTAARRIPTLELCLTSLAAAGWQRPKLFIDGDLQLPRPALALPQTVRYPTTGAWSNYYHSLAELLETTRASFLMIVQDDAWWPTQLPVRQYLEQIHWPSCDRFIVSAYCCANDTSPIAGWRQYGDIWKYGAVALIFSRSAAAAFISDPVVSSYGKEQFAGIDSIIGEWAERNRIPLFIPTPSLVQHIGDVSTLWRTARAVGVRRASRFIGDELVLPVAD